MGLGIGSAGPAGHVTLCHQPQWIEASPRYFLETRPGKTKLGVQIQNPMIHKIGIGKRAG